MSIEKLNKQQLEDFLIGLNENYRAGNPKISDKKYDEIVSFYRSKFKDEDFIHKNLLGEKGKVKLPIQMASLDNLKSVEELNKWISKIGSEKYFVITPKYDGISSLVIVNEEGISCMTRGDGTLGHDVSGHFKSVCSTSPMNYSGYYLGEEIMKKEVFKEKYSEEYANPRNMVAGLFNKTIPTYHLNDVDFIPYGYIPLNQEDLNSKSMQMLLLGLEGYKAGVRIVGHFINEKLLNQLFEEFSQEYEIDGLVIDVDENKVRTELGRAPSGNPEYSKAIKLEVWQSSEYTTVTGFELKVSKQGYVKPVIKITPTEIGGVMISRVSGHNLKYIKDHKIHPGATIEIIRSGDVIPKHVNTISYEKGEFKSSIENYFKYCPSCGSELEHKVEAICTNYFCDERRLSELVSFFEIMKIEDFGEPTIQKLFENGYVHPSVILSMSVTELKKIEGIGDKLSMNLITQFFELKSKGVSISKFLHSLNYFDGIGERKFDNIISHIKDNPKDVFQFSKEILRLHKERELTNIPMVSKKTEKILVDGSKFILGDAKKYVEELSEKVKVIPLKKSIEGFLSGKTFAFSGFRDEERANHIRENGGIYSDSLKITTQYLVVKDLNSTSSKTTLARKRGIQIISTAILDEIISF